MNDFDRQLFLLAPLGLSLLAAGLFQLLAARLAWIWRATLTGGFLAFGFATTATLLQSDDLMVGSALIFPVVPLIVAAARLTPVRSLRPMPVAITAAFAGLAIFTVAVVRYESGLAEKIENDSSDMELLGSVSEREIDSELIAVTDRGRTVELWRPKVPWSDAELNDRERRSLQLVNAKSDLPRVAPANESTNCHGWVFTGGRYVLGNLDIEKILTDNDYVAIEHPRPGDLAIYRNNGGVSHTAVVREAEPGHPIIVESKWSWMSAFRHAVDESIYGKDYQFFRTTRPDHLVKVVSRSTVILSGAE
jgi:hypothetical protein